MTAFARSLTVYENRIDEILENLRIHQAHSFFVRNQGELFGGQGIRAELKEELTGHLKSAEAVKSVFYRGLVLQLYGAFERLMGDLARAVLDVAEAKAARYSDLHENLRNAHTVGASMLMSKLNEQQINGIPYDFVGLQRDLAACFGDHMSYRLSSDAFSALLGVCNAERVGKLFRRLRLGEAFDDELGKVAALKTWGRNGGAREVKKLATKTLDDNVRLRNNIAHGSADSEITDTQVVEAAVFYRALGTSLLLRAQQISSGW